MPTELFYFWTNADRFAAGVLKSLYWALARKAHKANDAKNRKNKYQKTTANRRSFSWLWSGGGRQSKTLYSAPGNRQQLRKQIIFYFIFWGGAIAEWALYSDYRHVYKRYPVIEVDNTQSSGVVCFRGSLVVFHNLLRGILKLPTGYQGLI